MKRAIALPLLAVVSAGVLFWGSTVTPPQPAPAPAAAGVEFLPANAEDIPLMTTGVPADKVLFTVGEVEITNQEYLYWLGSQTDQFYQTMYAYGMSELDLSEEMEDGVTWDDWVKETARQQSILVANACELAGMFGVEQTAEDLQELAELRQNNIESLGGPEAYAQRLQAFGIDDETFFRIQANASLLSKTEKAATTVDETCTPEEAAAYAQENDLLRAKHILLLTGEPGGEPYDEATQAAQLAKAQDLLAQLRAEPGKFDELMNANSEDSGLAANPDGYLFSAGQMVAEFESGVRALAYGEISDIVESPYGYHILLRLDPDCDQLRTAVIRARQAEATENFTQTLYDWVDNAPVVTDPAYDTFTAAGHYEKLMAYQETLTEPTVDDQSTAQLEPAG